MKVLKITAAQDTLAIALAGGEKPHVYVRELAPTVSPEPASQLALLPCTADAEGRLVIPRYDGARDRLYSRFEVWSEDGRTRAEGVAYVTDFAPDAHQWNAPYPQAPSKKGTHAHGDDIETLGVCHVTYNVNLCALFSATPDEGTFPYEYNGRTFHIRQAVAEAYDRDISELYRHKLNISLIMLNSPRLFGGDNNPLLNSLAVHPRYNPEGFISAFNMRTDDGVAYYGAFLDYLASRYMGADAPHGRATGFIVSNEVDSQWVWGNAGEMPVAEYVREYTAALRLAWLTANKYWSAGRAYISLDHLFNISFDLARPLAYYKGREVLEELAGSARAEGDFGWDVAYHPYPENLMYPDFWNDRSASFDFSTPRITFKNIEVLPAFMAQEQMRYRGGLRHIIFSEQGFNSYDARTEELAFAAYCLAYKKIEKQPMIESFIYHAYVDNRHEFGLRLGLRRWGETPGSVGAPKPAWYAMRDMGTEREAAALEKARRIIGEQVWDEILNPRVLAGERDMTAENEFATPSQDDKAKKDS